MKQSSSFVNSAYLYWVCYLKRTLYGLKQSGRYWYQRLCEILVNNLSFICCNIDKSVFFRISDYKLIIIIVYVNDYMIVITSIKLVDWVKNSIKGFVEITNLEKIYWLLDIKLRRDWKTSKLMLFQWSYINASLHYFGLANTKLVSILINSFIYLTSSQLLKSTVEIVYIANIVY